MDDVGLAIGWFIVAYIFHMLLHRVFFRREDILILLVSLYFLGIPIVILKHIFYPLPGIHLLVSSCFISFISGAIMTVFYFSGFFKGQTPSSMLLTAFSKQSAWTKKELLDIFSEDKLINARLYDLEKRGLIRREGRTYFSTKKGSLIFSVLCIFLRGSGVEVGG